VIAEAARLERTRRHPLQVTASRLREALHDYPQVFDAPSRAVAEVLAMRMENAVEGGVLDEKAAPPLNPGQPFDQRQGHITDGTSTAAPVGPVRASK
jgi:hypothetical protein